MSQVTPPSPVAHQHQAHVPGAALQPPRGVLKNELKSQPCTQKRRANIGQQPKRTVR